MWNDMKEFYGFFKGEFKKMTWKERLTIIGEAAFGVALVIGGIYAVAFAGYISGT